MSHPIPDNEAIRLSAIRELEILDTAPHPDFDNLVAVTREILNVPMVALSIVDADRQWFKARIGIDDEETPRDVAFCAHTICDDEPLVVPDATIDPRFCNNRLVTDGPRIRAYAGVQLFAPAGVNVGTLCIIDIVPRVFLDSELLVLRQLGDLTNSMLTKHKMARENAKSAKALANQVRLFDRACELAKMGAWELDSKTDTLLWTDSMYDLHDVKTGTEIKLDEHLSCYLPSDRVRLESLMSSSRSTNEAFTFEGRMYTAKGNMKWVRVSSDVDVENGVPIRRFGMKQDITEHKVLVNRVERLAQHDDLTGVLNRRGLHAHLSDWSRIHKEGAFPLTYITFDLDGFKDINDSFGHAAGDGCLRRIARRAKIVLKDTGKIARTSGDEFSIIRSGDCSAQSTVDFVKRLMTAIAQPISWSGHTFRLRASVGSSTRPAGTYFDPDDVVREADLALFEAKREGKSCYLPYAPEFGRRLIDKTEVLHRAKAALAEGRFELYYQPKINLVDSSIIGFECLLRMNTPEGKVLSPAAFQAALDDPVVSKDIGDYVVEAALDQAAHWMSKGVSFGSVAINLSASQCREADFAERLLEDISRRGLPTSAVQVEVTEGVFLSGSGDSVLKACKTLSNGGVRISFDDFGTGFASLTHLRDFPVDELKIDRSFVGDLTRKGNLAIVAAMVSLGNNLAMSVVAEGVETEAQAALLKGMGCRYAQGYLYSRPVPATAAVDLITSMTPALQNEGSASRPTLRSHLRKASRRATG